METAALAKQATPKRIRLVRESVSKVVQLLSGKNVPVTMKGSNAYVKNDPKTGDPINVNIPVIEDTASDEMLDAIQGFVDHECAHILFTNSKVGIAAHNESNILGVYWNIVEDTYIERCMSKAFLGAAYNLGNTRNLVIKKFTHPAFEELVSKPESTELQYWNILSVMAMRAWAGHSQMEEYMADKWSYISNVVDNLRDIQGEFENLTSSEECLSLAREIVDRLFIDDEDEPNSSGYGSRYEDEDGDDELGTSSKNSSSDDDSGDSSDEDTSTGGDSSEDEGSSGGSEASDDSSGGESSDSDQAESSSKSTDSSNDSGSEQAQSQQDKMTDHTASPKLFKKKDFDEDQILDFDRRIEKIVSDAAVDSHTASDYVPFSLDNDVLERAKDPGVDPVILSTVERISQETNDMIGPLARQLSRAFIAMNKSSWERGRKRGKINAASLHRLSVDDDRVMKKQIVSKTQDVAVQLVVDCSGSMAGYAIMTAMSAAWALGSVLDKLKISNEIIGFTTRECPGQLFDEWMRSKDTYDRVTPIYMPIFKEWNEPFNNKQKRRIAAWASSSYGTNLHTNVDGESVRYAADRLLKRPEPGKTMIVLSDGLPSASPREDSSRLISHLKSVCKDIESQGVNLVGIGIDTDAPARFYRKHVLLSNIGDLPGVVIEELRRAILKK